MFLAQLTKEEQHSFMNLVSVLIMADQDIAKEEMQIFNEYQKEIGEFIPFNEKSDFDAELGKIKDMPVFKKKRVYFELLAVAKGDNIFVEEEKALMRKVQNIFGITDSEAGEIENYLDKLTNLYKELDVILS